MKNIPTDFRFDSRGPRRLVRVLLAVFVLIGILSVSVGFYIDNALVREPGLRVRVLVRH